MTDVDAQARDQPMCRHEICVNAGMVLELDNGLFVRVYKGRLSMAALTRGIFSSCYIFKRAFREMGVVACTPPKSDVGNGAWVFSIKRE